MLKKKMLTDKSGTLHEEMLEQAARRMAEDIDAEIIRSMFIESGWHEVVLQPMTIEQGCEIDDWVDVNCKGEKWTRGIVWLFENETDAMWFKMRWMSA